MSVKLSENLLLVTDGYKFGHFVQYPPNTTKVYSYFESRGGEYSETVFFGLQILLKKYLEGTVVTQEKIDEAYELCKLYFGDSSIFNKAGWEYILHEYNGKLPVSIKAVPEGTVVPTHNVLMTVENTDPKCYWLTNYLETLLVQVWYPITVATQSRAIKKLILAFLQNTGDPSLIDFKLHDFGFRGVSSVESAGIGGLAHLVNFKGTDTVEALVYGRKYYNTEMAGFTIPASEHSTITSWGKDREEQAYFNMANQYWRLPNRACVIDSYDPFKAAGEIWGDKLKDWITKNMNGTIVLRPDSGDPVEVNLKLIKILADKFGYTTNDKGFRVLNPKVRIIQGDGVNSKSIFEILDAFRSEGWSADNIGFGMGGALLQKLNRDTQKFAFKCSYVEGDVEGQSGIKWARDVFKEPITDKGKVSKRGRLILLSKNGFTTKRIEEAGRWEDQLVEVFRDGRILKEYTLEEVRERAKVE